MAKNITKENFRKEVLENKKSVLIDFWASWCNPCKMLSPVIDEIAKEADGRYEVGKINIEEQPELAKQFGIMSIPALLVFENGEVIKKTIGLQRKGSIQNLLQS